MPKTPNKRKIGLFILIGFISFFAIIISSIWDDFFPDNDNLIVMYFDESIKGLNVGSPVVFKGVEVGKVSRIELRINQQTDSFKIPVYVRLKQTQELIDLKKRFVYRKQVLDSFIEKGLRARLASQNLLTGQLMIELEIEPNSPAIFNNKTNNDILEIPTVLSSSEKLVQGIQSLPIKQTIEQLNSILNKLNKSLPIILPKLEKIINQLSNMVTEITPQTTDTLINFNQTLTDVSSAAKALRNFADYLERHPEALLKGKGAY